MQRSSGLPSRNSSHDPDNPSTILLDQQYVCETLVSLVISTTKRVSFRHPAEMPRVCSMGQNLPQHDPLTRLSGDGTDATHMAREGP